MRVLVVEDDMAAVRVLTSILEAEQFVVNTATTLDEALDMAKFYDYDVVLLDLMLPDGHGSDLLRRFREARLTMPVLILSGLGEQRDVVKGIDGGADDYVTKPFNKQELLARMRAVVRRSKGYADAIVRVGRLSVDLNAQQAEVDGKPLQLTRKEYAILELLVLRKGFVLGKEMFLNHLYGGMDEPELKIIDVFVCKLRKKISAALGCEENYIQTVWGRGYILRDSQNETQQAVAEESALSAANTETAPKRRQA